MTYSQPTEFSSLQPSQVLRKLIADAHQLDRLLQMCDDVKDLRGLRSSGSSGGRSSGGVSRPTEDTALDEARQLVNAELVTAGAHLVNASAYVLGSCAALDRALSIWEGKVQHGDGGR